MAIIETTEAGGDWKVAGTWVGGVPPTEAQDAYMTEKCKELLIQSGVKCRSFEAHPNCKGKLRFKSNGATIGNSEEPQPKGGGLWAFKIGSELVVEETVASLKFASTYTAATLKIGTSGKQLGKVENATTISTSAKYILEDELKATEFEWAKGSFNSNGKLITSKNFLITGTSVRTVNIEGSTIKLTGTGTVWNATVITNLTFKSTGSTIEVTDTSTTGKVFITGNELHYDGFIPSGEKVEWESENHATFIKKLKVFNKRKTAEITAKSASKVLTVESTGTLGRLPVVGEELVASGLEAGTLVTAIISAPEKQVEISKNATFATQSIETVPIGFLVGPTGQVFIEEFSTNGVVGELARIAGKSDGFYGTFVKEIPTVNVEVDYMIFKDIQGAVGAEAGKWYVGSHSRNVVHNEGLIFQNIYRNSFSVTQEQAATPIRQSGLIKSVTQAQATSVSKVNAFSRIISLTQSQLSSLALLATKTINTLQEQSASPLKIPSFSLSVSQGQSASLAKGISSKFAVLQAQVVSRATAIKSTLSVTQASETSLLKLLSRSLSVAQEQVVTTSKRAGKKMKVTQAQVAEALKSLPVVLSVAQAQNVSLSKLVPRIFFVIQEQVLTFSEELKLLAHFRSIELFVEQEQTTRVGKFTEKVLTVAQPVTATTSRVIAKVITNVQNVLAEANKIVSPKPFKISQAQSTTVESVRLFLHLLTLNVAQEANTALKTRVGKVFTVPQNQEVSVGRGFAITVNVVQNVVAKALRSIGVNLGLLEQPQTVIVRRNLTREILSGSITWVMETGETINDLGQFEGEILEGESNVLLFRLVKPRKFWWGTTDDPTWQ
jgi:hypothetical protein